MVHSKQDRWHVNKSAIVHSVKKPVGFEEWFYTGPTKWFGHKPNPKKGKR